MTILTQRFTDAVDYARIAHATHYRKGTSIPYIYHLLGVSSLVLEYGGSEDQAIAGLLHDVLEDCGAGHEASIRAGFGDVVADIVKDCTDGTPESKGAATTHGAKLADWQRRKVEYLGSLSAKSDTSLLVSGCDKLHNARAILIDLEGSAGDAVFERFTAKKDGTLRYYASLGRILTARDAPMAKAFDGVVALIHERAGGLPRQYLE